MSLINQRNRTAGDKKTPTQPTPATPAGETPSPLIVSSMNARINAAKALPIPKKLFLECWIEGEISILFATSNVGKSILSVQIAEAIASGRSIGGFAPDVKPQKVLYLDFELSDKQLEARASMDYKEHYTFSENLLTATLNDDYLGSVESMESAILAAIETTTQATGAKIVIIDNITYIKSDNERAKEAIIFMQQLKRIKKKHGLSILVLAHTPKRDISQPLSQRDLQGSSALSQFCDSMFAIGASNIDANLRYIKQIKCRNAAFEYTQDNVIVCEICKPCNFVYFDFVKYDHEREHLRIRIEGDELILKDKIIEMYEAQKYSLSEIASACDVTKSKVQRTIEKHRKEQAAGDEFPPELETIHNDETWD